MRTGTGNGKPVGPGPPSPAGRTLREGEGPCGEPELEASAAAAASPGGCQAAPPLGPSLGSGGAAPPLPTVGWMAIWMVMILLGVLENYNTHPGHHDDSHPGG